MRRCLLLVLCLALLVSGAHAQERDFAEGSKEVLGYQPDLPATASTASTLKQILARPEFHEAVAQPPGPSLLERILQWFSKHLGGIGAGLAGAGTVTLFVAGGLIACLLVLLVYVIVRSIWSRLNRASVSADLDLPIELLSAAGLKELSRQAAASGDFQSALRYRFKSIVGQLDVLDSERQTNWQLLRHVRRNLSGATAEFAELIALFEDSWYGGQLTDPGEFARAEVLALSVEKALAPREEAA